MDRTTPSFRIASMLEEKEWKSFRNSLDKSERKMFDDMLVSGFGGIRSASTRKLEFLQ
jgi:hypothetical protein